MSRNVPAPLGALFARPNALSGRDFQEGAAYARSRSRHMEASILPFPDKIYDATSQILASYPALEAVVRSAPPRAQLYAENHVPGDTRRHLYSHGETASPRSSTQSTSRSLTLNAEDCERAPRPREVGSGALTFYKWGCRQDPRTWDWSLTFGTS